MPISATKRQDFRRRVARVAAEKWQAATKSIEQLRRHRFIHAKNADVLRAHRRPQQPVNEGTIEVQVIQSDMAGMTIKLLRLDTNGEFTSQKLYKCLELQRLLSYGSLHDRRREHRRRSELRLYNHVSLIGFYTTCVLRYNLHKMKSQLHNMTCICLHIS
ncbi:unnamed protein product [Peronospora belbahrii]|uniref:Uncharacterized protein n=1 Tax=Peronospora belbahrii TaxID=622444 RepID=A0ABN8DBL3_9STRA|nr:unnamed protein product [Peronospora belbahrii]